MKLIHYSAEPLKTVRSYEQDPNHHGYNIGKPRGLWVSVEGEDDWESWCKNEGFGLERLAVAMEVVLSPGARIKYITDAIELRAFQKEYGIRPPWYQDMIDKGYEPPEYTLIDWTAVAKKYQGIIIAPYIYECRLAVDTFWYYGWDCASGCIWDAGAVSATVVEVRHVSVNERAA